MQSHQNEGVVLLYTKHHSSMCLQKKAEMSSCGHLVLNPSGLWNEEKNNCVACL